MTPQRFNRLTSVLNRRQPDITVVLENVFDPHNVSAVMRTCDAVGIQDIYILNDRIPPHKKWGYRSSSTADKWLSVHQFTHAEECFNEIKKKYERIYTSHLGESSANLYSMDLTQSMALVFGNETFGVSENIRKYADGDFIIPQVGIIKSLNISVACAVTLYEAFRQKKEKGHYENPRLSESKMLELQKQWKLIDES
ncbi:MAG TPA: RNA methyltransferase [Hanamia sp.]|nr:RNA methyltransferase [Hanamia sp.]